MADYDIVIVGGGLAGTSLACALRHLPLKIALLEANQPRVEIQTDFDARSVALAYGSRQIFTTLDIWQTIAKYAVPIEQIHVSDKGRFGQTKLIAKNYQVPAFGYVIEIQYLLQALYQTVQKIKQVNYIAPARVEQVNLFSGHSNIILQDGRQITATLLVAADGGQSAIRELLKIPNQETAYRQHALIANVSLQREHQNIAYERFTAQGPLALLPLTEQRCGLVLTLPPDSADDYQSLSNNEFLTLLQKWFGYRLGRFTEVGQRQIFPLKKSLAKQQVLPGVVLIGNAAHTLHPIAGQGFNLGLRDIAVLAQVIRDSLVQHRSIGDITVLQRYLQWRKQDQRFTMGFTDHLARLFSNDFIPFTLVRNVGLSSMNLNPLLQKLFTRNTMGLAGKLPDLTLGIPLALENFHG